MMKVKPNFVYCNFFVKVCVECAYEPRIVRTLVDSKTVLDCACDKERNKHSQLNSPENCEDVSVKNVKGTWKKQDLEGNR